MTTQWNPFKRPRPLAECLMHEAVLVQAWKKSHAYIRTRNWYADVLELDLSAANLKSEIERWRLDYSEKDLVALKPAPMRLVPAPKAGTWEFGEDSTGNVRWQPKLKNNKETGKDDQPVMRPLAHLAIRDQTFATAAMVCLADIVETAQGNCSLPTKEAKKSSVCSYGNRLYCEWEKSSRPGQPDQANFGWGNANSYRKYYSDYQAFLKRPRDICLEEEPFLEAGEELGVVALDLAGFYDRIDPQVVIKTLRILCKKWEISSDTAFWDCLKKIFSWSWANDDIPVEKLLRDGKRPKGLPQGLVASGFFSNVYMLDFDTAISEAIGDRQDRSFTILDYCRYVDDIRLVVRWHNKSKLFNEAKIKKQCTDWVNGILSEHAVNQECNLSKTEYTCYQDLRSKSGRAATMELIQRNLSGPMDMEVMEETSIALDGLLRSIETDPIAAQWGDDKNIPELAKVFKTSSEIRDDTLKRFATYRQFKLLRERRQQVCDDTSNEGYLECQRIDADIEITARRMIRFWTEDPSLTIVLRHAMNLLPTPDLLNPVLAAIRYWIENDSQSESDAIPYWVCLYEIADLFRAGVIETGIGVPPEALPQKSDLPGYQEMLAEFAEWLLGNPCKVPIPWYIKQQAVMFLISVGRHVSIGPLCKESALCEYVNLLRASQGKISNINQPEERLAPLMIVASQFQKNNQMIVSRLARWLSESDPNDAIHITEQLYLGDLPLFQQLLEYTENKEQHRKWRDCLDDTYILTSRLKAARIQSRHRLSLAKVASAVDNPFKHENAALRLLMSLIDFLIDLGEDYSFEKLSPHSIQLNCPDWSRLKNPCWKHEELRLKATFANTSFEDPRYLLPNWCSAERRSFMVLGRLLRVAITGELDYTSTNYFGSRDREGYQGIRSSWYKRQYGMFQRPDALGGPQASCSPWITELLAKLLMWPGCRETNRMIPDWNKVRTLTDLRVLALERLKEQASIFAQASDLPVYIYPVGLKLKSPPKLTTVLVQTVRPIRDDFDKYGVRLDGAGFKAIRRGHLASLLRIAEKLLNLRNTYGKDTQADLILLPELSVHEDDLDLIERIVDRTHAMAFCGLVFRSVQGGNGLVNTARWIIPDQQATGRSLIHIDQGKQHMTDIEKRHGIQPWRPHQVVIELQNGLSGKPYRITGSVCFDATDLELAADLRDITDMFVIPANNKDVTTFDAMAGTLSYHMYQHVLVVNTGEFGGTTVMAPYTENHERVLTHHHGGGHASVAIVDIDLSDYQQNTMNSGKQLKTPPAGYLRHGLKSVRTQS